MTDRSVKISYRTDIIEIIVPVNCTVQRLKLILSKKKEFDYCKSISVSSGGLALNDRAKIDKYDILYVSNLDDITWDY